jgi:hypothetical protein
VGHRKICGWFRIERVGQQPKAASFSLRFVGTGYFDAVQQAITSGKASTTALEGSTEAAQFHPHAVPVHKIAGENKRVAAD